MNLVVTVPMPDKCLSPNARSHWATKNGAKAAARDSAQVETNRQLVKVNHWPPVPCTLNITIRGPRQSDGDNALGRLKATIDGIAKAMGVNDRDFTFAPIRFEKRGQGGNKYRLADPTDVEITISPTLPAPKDTHP